MACRATSGSLLLVSMTRKHPSSRVRPGVARLTAVSPLRLRLKELREARGLSQRALADMAGVSNSTIARIETDSLRNVTLDMVEKLSDALGVTPAALIEHTRPKREPRWP